MGIAMLVGTDGLDNIGRGTFLGGDRRAKPANRAEGTVAGPVLRAVHIVGHEGDFPAQTAVGNGLERVERIEIGNLGGNPCGSRAGAIAQGGDRKHLRVRGNDLRCLCTAHPGRH